MDGIVQRVLSQPIYNSGFEYAEDEDYDIVRSAAFIYDANKNFIKSHANVLDCRQYCADIYNAKCWPRATCDNIIDIDDLEPQLQYNGTKIRFI